MSAVNNDSPLLAVSERYIHLLGACNVRQESGLRRRGGPSCVSRRNGCHLIIEDSNEPGFFLDSYAAIHGYGRRRGGK